MTDKPLCTLSQAMAALNTPPYLHKAIQHMQQSDEQDTLYTASRKFEVAETELQTEYGAVLSAMYDPSSAANRAVQQFLAA